MKKPRIGLVGLYSPLESGGERHDSLISQVQNNLTQAGLDVVTAKGAVKGAGDALAACTFLQDAEIDALVLMDVTWVTDSLKYIFVHELDVPVIFWAVPYPETFSIGCVQNFTSVLHTQGIHSEYVYGLPEDPDALKKVAMVALTGHAIHKTKKMRIALVGPRQTWRVAGPQDMSLEEWDFSKKFGATLVHFEMEEIMQNAQAISDEQAAATFESLKARTGKLLCSEEALLWNVKLYMAVKDFLKVNAIDAAAMECYPQYGGQMNLTASWLADEGIILDTEGDIAHTFLQYLLQQLSPLSASVLGETGALAGGDDDYLFVCHEGSSAVSMASDQDLVTVHDAGGTSTFVGFPYKATDHVTVCDMQGCGEVYQLMVAAGRTLPVTQGEWSSAGEKMVMKLQPKNVSSRGLIDHMLENGLHHHLVVKQGDCAEILKCFCRYSGTHIVEL